MKPNELQIGDWITCESKNGKVKELREHKLSLRTENSVMIVYYDSVDPIPLTAEILKNNGFHESTLRDERWINQDIALTKVDDVYILSSMYDDFMIGIRPRIFTVHELQHALRLCNIEKEIKL